MCGITGFTGSRNTELLRQMCASLIHRGPDEEGYYESSGVSLAMRRLAIIDLSTGQQPISNETGDVWVVLNGEIYNYEELRSLLTKAGHVFKTESDTETIVHAYEEFGLDFVNYLRGMFGLAIWDERKNRLVLARDRVGEKPLYYALLDGRLSFGSEIKAVLKGLHSRTVDSQSVCDYLCAGYVGAPRTFFKEVKKLGPGEMGVFENGSFNTRKYWSHEPMGDRVLTFDEACDLVESELLDAVRLCLKSDVEVAAFLSGGIDSSIIVALMDKLSVDIQTFSVGYGGAASGFNELRPASRVSKHVGTEHHELILDAASNIELLPKVIHHFDEPHGEPTSVLVYLLCEFVQKKVKVALSGTGGDEIFFGYPRHAGVRYLQYYKMLPLFVRKQIVERIAASLPESTRGGNFLKRVKRFVNGASEDPAHAYLNWVKLLHPDLHQELISDSLRNELQDPSGDEFLRRSLIDPTSGDVLNQIAGLDVGGYLPEYQLSYMDRMSMACSLEVRAPLCDFKLVELATSLPVNYRLKGTRSKHILKTIASKYLPQDIIERRKVGFDSPIGQWFKGELNSFVDSFLSEEQVAQSGLLNPEVVRRMLADHLAGRSNYSLQLWSIVSLEAWYRMYIDDRIEDIADYSLSDIRGVPNGRTGISR